MLRIGILGLLLLAGLAAPREAPAYSTCYGCVGWDGAGIGSATLSYYFGSLTHDGGLTDSAVKSTLVSAANKWSEVADIHWAETSTARQSRAVDFNWSTGTYGPWGQSFPAGALAIGYYPSPPNYEPYGGDIYFNDAYTWFANGGSGFDIFSVALHELGHALGLAHSSDPNAVMYAYYHKVTGLHQDDIDGILSMYAAVPPPPPEQPLPPPVVYYEANNPVPEPGTLFLLGSGLAGLGAWARRRSGRSR